MAGILVIEHVSVSERDGSAAFVVRLIEPEGGNAQTVTVDWRTDDETASRFSDFTAASGTLTFRPGETRQVISVAITDNAIAEFAETFAIELSRPTNATIGASRAVAVIADDDASVSASPLVSIEGALVNETDGTARLVLRLDRPSASGISVDWRTVAGTATAGQDFEAATENAVFAPGQVLVTIEVPLLDDALAEGPERFFVELTDAEGASLGDARAAVRIAPSDLATSTLPAVRIDDVTVGEGDGVAWFTLGLSAPSAGPVSVAWRTDDETASRFSDFVATSGTVVFAPGETVRRIAVGIEDDATIEPNFESFHVELTTVTGGTIADPRGRATILDDDATGALPLLVVEGASVNEGDTAAVVVRLASASTEPVTVRWATQAATAAAGSDFRAEAGTITFQPGEMARTLHLDIPDDTQVEGAERFFVALSDPTGAALGQARAEIRIAPSDQRIEARPAIRIDDVTVGEGDGLATLTLSLSAPSAAPVTVDWRTDDQTASRFSDFVSGTGTVTFLAGETRQTVTIGLRADALAEPVESFTVVLDDAAGGIIAGDTGRVTIVDDDVARDEGPRILIAGRTVDEASGSVFVDVVLDAVSDEIVTVAWRTLNGTARAGQDFAADSGVLTFLPGQVTRTVEIRLNDDALREAEETFLLALSNPVGASLPEATAEIRIAASDAPSVARPFVRIGDATVDEGDSFATSDEGDSFATFEVALSAPSSSPVLVNWRTDDQTASRFSDFVAATGSLTFLPGETLRTVRVELRPDQLQEGIEHFQVKLSLPTGSNAAALARDTGVATIVDDDASAELPLVALEEFRAVNESDGTLDLAVRLSAAADGIVRVRLVTEFATAFGDDVRALDRVVTFLPGETAKTVTLDLIDNNQHERLETFHVVAVSAEGAAIGQGTTLVAIADDDGPRVTRPGITAEAVDASEGDAFAELLVRLDRPAAGPVTVDWRTNDGTASRFSDFVSDTGTVTFLPGETVQRLRIGLRDDATVEVPERFDVVLSNAVGGTVIGGTIAVNVADNDAASAAGPVMRTRAVTVQETAGWAEIPVTLSEAATGLVTVRWATRGGTARDGLDFRGASGTLAFLPGDTVQVIRVPILDDLLREGLERFDVVLRSPQGAVFPAGSALAAIVTVASEDSAAFRGTRTAETFTGTFGNVTVDYGASTGGVTVDLARGEGRGGFASNDAFAGIANLLGSSRNDVLSGDAAINQLFGRRGNDQLRGLDGDDELWGEAGNDVLDGGDGDDLLSGGGGADLMRGGAGNDAYDVDDAGDRVIEARNGGFDAVFASVSTTLELHVENLTLRGTAAIQGTGNAAANAITGNVGANRLSGEAGNDVLKGEAGNDVLQGGLGADRLFGGAGADRFVFASVADSAGRAVDRIEDFSRAQRDRIDLRGIDAGPFADGDQAFTFIGSAAFSDASQVRAVRSGGGVAVSGDLDGDGTADFAFQVFGVTALRAGDFLL